MITNIVIFLLHTKKVMLCFCFIKYHLFNSFKVLNENNICQYLFKAKNRRCHHRLENNNVMICMITVCCCSSRAGSSRYVSAATLSSSVQSGSRSVTSWPSPFEKLVHRWSQIESKETCRSFRNGQRKRIGLIKWTMCLTLCCILQINIWKVQKNNNYINTRRFADWSCPHNNKPTHWNLKFNDCCFVINYFISYWYHQKRKKTQFSTIITLFAQNNIKLFVVQFQEGYIATKDDD